MNKFIAAFKFYFLEGFKAKSYLITLAIMCAIVFIAGGITQFNGDSSKDNVSIINESSYTVDKDALEKGIKTVTLSIDSKDEFKELRDKVTNRKIDGLFVIKEENGKPIIVESYNTFQNNTVRMALSQQLESQYIQKVVKEGNISSDIVSKLFAPVEVKDDIVKDSSETFGIVYIFVFLMYMLILMFGQSIGTSIASEKSSRVTEVMLSKIPPMSLLYAKITSLLFLALIQIGGLVGSFFICRGIGLIKSNQLEMFGGMLNLDTITPFILTMFVIYFLLGYLLYATLYAAAGALVSRVEDLQTSVTPIVILVVSSFFLGMYSMTNPTHIAVVISSYIPLFSPIVTFSRIIAGEAGGAEIATTMGIMIVTFILLNKFVSRIYLNGIMNYSEKFSWKSVLVFAKKH